MPWRGSTATGCWGTVRTITGMPDARLVDLVDEVHALDAALEQRVDEDDVGPQLGHQTGDPRPVGDDVEQLDRRLRVEESADVLRDLGDVLDDEESELIRHRADSTTHGRGPCPAPMVPSPGPPG